MIDEDLGISGSGLSERSGFARLTAEVALGHAGLVLGLEVSRLARNNVDWYRLLDLCGVTDTVIGDADGIYHPGSFNDRLLLGLKGTMSEAELHVLRARLQGGIRNKAERGELRKALPVGLVWGEADGEILLDPDEAIRGAIATIFDRFAELGSVRQVWLWMRRERVQVPDAPLHPRRDRVDGPDLPPGPQRARQPRLRRRVRVREDPPRALRRRAREHTPADASPPPSRMGRLDLGSPPRLRRQGHVREQPRADRCEHPPARAPSRRCRARRQRAAARDRDLRALRAQAPRRIRRRSRPLAPGLPMPRPDPG